MDDTERKRLREAARKMREKWRAQGFDGAVRRAVMSSEDMFSPIMTLPEGPARDEMRQQLSDAIGGVMANYYPRERDNG